MWVTSLSGEAATRNAQTLADTKEGVREGRAATSSAYAPPLVG